MYVGWATIYTIGPGQTYTSFNQFHASIGWHNLVAGDEVRIFYRAEPYREFIFLSGKGTPNAHIRVVGVLGPNGERPVIDGNQAVQPSDPSNYLKFQDLNNFIIETDGILDVANGNSEPNPTDPNVYTYYKGGLYHLGLVVVGRKLGSDWLDSPQYIDIENLEIRNARENYQFKPHFSGNVAVNQAYQAVYNAPWQSFPAFASGIWVQRCEHFTLKNCYLHDNGNGVFINSQAFDNGNGSASDLLSRDVLIEKCVIENNGCAGGGFSCHNIYSEASQTIYQYNKIGKKYPGSLESNCLKDRGAGTVIRYNWFDATEQAHILDLVEAEASAAVMVNEPNYQAAYVYGNVFINPENGPTTSFHYSGDHQNYSIYRKGTLHFWNNTYVNYSNQSAKYNMYVFLFPVSENIGTTTMSEVLDAQNNIFLHLPSTIGATPSDFYLARSDGNATYNYKNNFISSNYIVGHSGKWVTDVNNPNGGYFAPFIGTSTFTNTINNPQNSPGFVDLSAQNFQLTASSIAINAGVARPEITQEYVKELNYRARSINAAMDVGAFEWQNCQSPNCLSVTVIKH